jgi:hypothetical protein
LIDEGLPARLDYEALFYYLEGLYPDVERRYWLEPIEIVEKLSDTLDIGEEIGQISAEVKIYLFLQYRSVSFVSLVTGLAERTIRRGVEETRSGLEDCPLERVRRLGVGRRMVR